MAQIMKREILEERSRLIAEKLETPEGRFELAAATWVPMVRSVMFGETIEQARNREYIGMMIQSWRDAGMTDEEVEEEKRKIRENYKPDLYTKPALFSVQV